MRYRRDIDGLRASAVLPVVFFHAGVPGFAAGFIGVDVFFVISGYLITSLISEEIRQERFSIVAFYERRVRRIFPALLVVLLVSSILATRILLPGQFNDFAKSVLATALFASNVLFWQDSGYFAASASEKPLLHCWSLAVEEQFYVVFPLVLFLVHRWWKGSWITWLAPLTVLSFILSVWGVTHKPSATFYLAPTRAWELLLGSLLALDAFPLLRSRPLMEVSSAAGLVSIGWGVFALSADSPFPGLNALFPCIGAALLIYSGEATPTYTSRLLGSWPLASIGLISYSLYLWHWPLLVFARLWNIVELTKVQTAAIVGISFLAAILSLRFVESPFRRKGGVFKRKALFAFAFTATALLVVFGLFGHFTQGWPERLPSTAVRIAAYEGSIDPRWGDCDGRIADACSYGADVSARFALWGDSHLHALAPGIATVAERYHQSLKLFTESGCPPILGIDRIEKSKGMCLDHNQAVMDELISDGHLTTIVMLGRYSVNLYGGTGAFGPAERGRTTSPLITNQRHDKLNRNSAENLFATQFPATVKQLISAGKRVIIVYPIPETGYDIPMTLARMEIEGRPLESFTRPFSYYRNRQSFIFHVLDDLGQSQQIVRVYPHRRLCDSTKCIVFADGKPLYSDDDHLSLAGADIVASLFDPIFEDGKPEELNQVLTPRVP